MLKMRLFVSLFFQLGMRMLLFFLSSDIQKTAEVNDIFIPTFEERELICLSFTFNNNNPK
jgi:hypothetical protein